MAKRWTLWLARVAATRKGYWAVALSSSAASAVASILIFSAVIPSVNERTLRTLDSQLLRRAELAVDRAFIALGGLFEGGFGGCDAGSIAKFKEAIYRYGAIKDIRISDSSQEILCSANPEALESSAAVKSSGPPLPSVNRRISLFRVDQNGVAAIGVRWSFDKGLSLDAVVSTDSLLFDILPQDLRENGMSSLTLTDGQSVAEPDGDQPVDPQRLRQISLASKRYPLIASIGVDMDTLAKANREPLLISLALFSIIGFGFGILAASLSIQSAGPIAEIDAALARGEFVPFVQPIYSLATREMVGVEVLARWRRADGTLIPPDRFIPVAESSGRIVPLTWCLARAALTELHDHLSRDRRFKVAFNIAPAHLLSSGFVGELRQIAVDTRISPRQIVIEITERQEITDVEKARQVLTELRDRGFRVAFDDVGTGHNGLSYLQKMEADIIKIDKFLVDSIAASHSAKVLVEMLVNVGRELEMTTVAEGIETEDQIACLKKCGVDQGQGYLLSRPLAIGDFLDLVRFAANGLSVSTDADMIKQAMIA